MAMANKLKLHLTINIHTPVTEVWKALTEPALIKQYLFGTDTVTDWKKGSAIVYSGVYQGKSYQDKGLWHLQGYDIRRYKQRILHIHY